MCEPALGWVATSSIDEVSGAGTGSRGAARPSIDGDSSGCRTFDAAGGCAGVVLGLAGTLAMPYATLAAEQLLDTRAYVDAVLAVTGTGGSG